MEIVTCTCAIGPAGSSPGFSRGIQREHSGREEILGERQLTVVLCFVAQTIFRKCAGRLKADLRSALVIATIAGAEVAFDVDKILENMFDPVAKRGRRQA